MAYPDLWRSKQCGSMPEIVMMWKSFLIDCQTSNSDKVNVYADNLGEAVRNGIPATIGAASGSVCADCLGNRERAPQAFPTVTIKELVAIPAGAL